MLAGCDKPRALGEANSIVVASSPEVWSELRDRIRPALQPTVFTMTDEETFLVNHVDPEAGAWGNMSRFRNLVVLGYGHEPWVQNVLDRYREEVGERPALVQVEDVWARGQQVNLVLLPEEEEPPEAFDEILEGIHAEHNQRFRQWAASRMFVSGRNDELADRLREEEGFALTLPQVYRHYEENGAHRVRNDNPSPSELIREVAVTWRSPIPEEVTRDDLVAWRQDMVEAYYEEGQEVVLDRSEFTEVEVDGRPGVELQASWESLPGAWPGGGPFIMRAIECPEQDRLYLVDAWLYAPSRPKYEYMIQLETVLNTFTCEG